MIEPTDFAYSLTGPHKELIELANRLMDAKKSFAFSANSPMTIYIDHDAYRFIMRSATKLPESKEGEYISETDKRFAATKNMLTVQGKDYDQLYLIETIRMILDDKELSPPYKFNRIRALVDHPSVKPRR